MTKESLAALLNGREYGDEITKSECADARAAGLLVIFGYSDDNMEFRGVFDDESSCFDGGTAWIHKGGILADHEDRCECQFCGYNSTRDKCVEINGEWCLTPEYSWTYRTNVPHASFDILENGEKYCRGIVISIADLPKI